MKQIQLRRIRTKLVGFAALFLLFAELAPAQTYYSYSGYGDLVAGFRKTGAFVENNELVVNLGNITNLLALSAGTTINMSNYSIVQVTNMCPDNLANLQWSVFSTFSILPGIREPYWNTPVGSIPPGTVWETMARTSFGTQTTPPTRVSKANQSQLRQQILAVDTGAGQISNDLVSTNQFNNFLLVTEPKSYDAQMNTISYLIGDPTDTTNGDFFGYSTFTVENTTPSPFSSPVRSDLYEMAPITYLDPFSQTTNGPAYYVGYFTMNNADGTMTFTRASAVSNPQPRPPILSVSSSVTTGGGGSTQVTTVISFSTTNAAAYTLYYTNSTGLTSPISTWPSISTGITGNNSVQSVTNVSTDPNRFYIIGAQ